MSRKSAPQRKIVDIIKVGNYGNVVWNHLLECGHIEQRKRRAPAATMACEQCEAGKPVTKERQGAVDSLASDMQAAALYSSAIAERLGIDALYVSVDVTNGKPGSAIITLLGDDIERILKEGK